MSIASADLLKAINTAWDASTLDATFKALWAASVTDSEWVVLEDQEAMAEHPFPYVVFEQTEGTTTDRMSGGASAIREIRDVPVSFRVHAREISGDSRTAKEIAAYLAEEIMKVFGGHPSTAVTGTMTLTNGNHLITQYQTDYGVRTSDSEYQWTLNYLFRLDVPVAC